VIWWYDSVLDCLAWTYVFILLSYWEKPIPSICDLLLELWNTILLYLLISVFCLIFHNLFYFFLMLILSFPSFLVNQTSSHVSLYSFFRKWRNYCAPWFLFCFVLFLNFVHLIPFIWAGLVMFPISNCYSYVRSCYQIYELLKWLNWPKLHYHILIKF